MPQILPACLPAPPAAGQPCPVTDAPFTAADNTYTDCERLPAGLLGGGAHVCLGLGCSATCAGVGQPGASAQDVSARDAPCTMHHVRCAFLPACLLACLLTVGGVVGAFVPLLSDPTATALVSQDCVAFATNDLPVCATTGDLFKKAGCCAKACADALARVRACMRACVPQAHPRIHTCTARMRCLRGQARRTHARMPAVPIMP